MTISIYQASVPVFSNVLRNLAHVLRKAEAAAHRKIEPSVFLQARLAPDMLTLTKQVQITEERQIVIRIAGADMPMAGMPYLLHHAMPNFYFHVTTAYAILRHNGVALGKGDFFRRG